MAGSGQCPSCGRVFPADGGYCPADGTRIVSTAPAARDDLVGKLLDGRYEIRDVLAPVRDGSIGAMYRGFQPSVSREVAIKVIHTQHVRDPGIVDRFLQAGRAAAQLAGPALANVYDVGRTSDGIVYVVSELARGTSLAQHTGSMPARRVVGLAIQLAEALAAIHRQQLVHGDLDPAAIVVDETAIGDQLKLLDVGFSASLVPARPGYAAPEVLAGQSPTPSSDLYSAGVILYELLVGAPPFVAASVEALAGKHRHELPPQLPPNIPMPLAAIVMRLLGKYSAERFPAATDLRAALREAEAVVGVAVPRTSSNPNIALPRTASADYGQPQLPRTASSDYGQPQVARTASGNYGQPQIARTPSGDYGQPQLAPTPSGDHGQPQLARMASGDHGYPVVARTPDPAASGSRRLLVIALVALIASGGGIAAILLAG